jgi:hypothetical protein
MKRLVIVSLACLLAPLASADLFKYIDKDGKTVYSDQPPAGIDSQRISAPGASAAAAPKSFLERDKEQDRLRNKAKEDAKKAEQKDEDAKVAVARCEQATQRHRTYVDGGRLFKYDAKGERVMLDDDEIAAERDKTRREMEEACKAT